MHLQACAVKTPYFEAHQSLEDFLVLALGDQGLRDGTLIAITSKIVSLAEGQLVAPDQMDRKRLIRQEADQILGEVSHNHTITLKHGLMIPGAGIDSSNSKNEDYILYPKDPWGSAERIGRFLRGHFGFSNLGVILTDSHSVPLRRGVVGISLAHWGFRGIEDCIGKPDLFGRPLKFTKRNVVDALAGMAVLLMGEGDESQPLAVIANAPVEFIEGADRDDLLVTPENDLYLALLKKRDV